VRIPIVIARGAHDGPVLGLTAALHGDELNGIPVIQRVVRELDRATLRGTVVGVLAANVPGVLLEQRVFNDGVDLNHIAPGKAGGTQSQVYMKRLVDRVVDQFDVLLDLHTASRGRVNSFYVRADMDHPVASRLARLQGPEIIVHNPPNDLTLRGHAASRGIPAITAELRDPGRFQAEVIEVAVQGIGNVMVDLEMVQGEVLCPIRDSILCSGSGWLYTDEGGLLEVLPEVTERVHAGQEIARVRDIWGEVAKTYVAPTDGMVIGRSVDPINQTGSRILHLGRDPRPIPCITEEAESAKLPSR
jgi:predicted deacylase